MHSSPSRPSSERYRYTNPRSSVSRSETASMVARILGSPAGRTPTMAVADPCVIDHIDRTLTRDGPLNHEQRARLLALAERYPVHRTLTGEIRVATQLT
jgi:hypothetical protein